MRTAADTVADILFALHWRTQQVSYTDRYFAQNVNFYRDCFPPQLGEALLGRSAGDKVCVDFGAGEIVPPAAAENRFWVHRSQFNSRHTPEMILAPCYGRFYPKGVLTGLTGVFKVNAEPFRCLGLQDGRVGVDFNHPLSEKPLRIEAEVTEVRAKPYERGGYCNDWSAILTRGPGMQSRCNGQATDFFSDAPFARADENPDSCFYRFPRMVHHLDAAARRTVSGIYRDLLRPGMRLLDLMSSWTSHLPEDLAFGKTTGLGMNAEELAENSRLDRRVVHDLNREPYLPFGDGDFDAVVCTVSVEYLVHPFQVFAEAARVLRPGGLLAVTFSNRWFPAKAVRIWSRIHEFERPGLVSAYFQHSSAFQELTVTSMRGLPRPPDDKYADEQWFSDPVYAVWGTRR